MKRIKNIKVLFIAAVYFCLMIIAVQSAECPNPLPGLFPDVPPPVSSLDLLAKDASTWKVIPGGARGTLRFNEKKGVFRIDAEKLPAKTSYSLVWYSGFKGDGAVLAKGKTDSSGKLILKGKWKNWTKKIWLVLSDDIDDSAKPSKLKAWHPDKYLFEAWELGVECK